MPTPIPYPPAPATPACVMLLIPVELVPIVGAGLADMEARRRWITDSDHQLGYRAFVALQDQLMTNCLDTLIAEIRALRGVKPDYASVPAEDRTTDMYRDFNDLIDHLNTITFALRGGEEPDDHILLALRGIVAASETRNIIDEL